MNSEHSTPNHSTLYIKKILVNFSYTNHIVPLLMFMLLNVLLYTMKFTKY